MNKKLRYLGTCNSEKQQELRQKERRRTESGFQMTPNNREPLGDFPLDPRRKTVIRTETVGYECG